MQDVLYDRLTQHAKRELLADVQMGGLQQSLESLRKAMAYGKKKTAENVTSRPESGDMSMHAEGLRGRWRRSGR